MSEHITETEPVCLWGVYIGGDSGHTPEGIVIIHHTTPLWISFRAGGGTLQSGARAFDSCWFSPSDSVLGPLSSQMRSSQIEIIDSLRKEDPGITAPLSSFPKPGQTLNCHRKNYDPTIVGRIAEVHHTPSSLQRKLKGLLPLLMRLSQEMKTEEVYIRDKLRDTTLRDSERGGLQGRYEELLKIIPALKVLIPFAQGQKIFLSYHGTRREVYAMIGKNHVFVFPQAVQQMWADPPTSLPLPVACAVNPSISQDDPPKFSGFSLGMTGIGLGEWGEVPLRGIVFSNSRSLSVEGNFSGFLYPLEIEDPVDQPSHSVKGGYRR